MLRLSTLGIPTGLGRTKFEDLLIQLFCLSLLLIPVGFLTIKSWVTTLSLVAFLLSIFLLARTQGRVPLDNLDKLLLLVFTLPLITDVSTQYLRSEWLPSQFDATARLLIFLPVYILLRRLAVNLLEPLDFSLPVGLLFSLLHLLYEPRYFWEERWASLPADPNTLGLFTAPILGYLMFRVVNTSITPIKRIMIIPGLVSGIVILIGTQSRGAWLSFAMLLILCVWLNRSKLKNLLIYILGPLLIGVLIMTSLNQSLMSRAISIPMEILGWVEGKEESGSAGTRLDMVNLTLKLATERPLIGFGDHGYATRAIEISTDAQMNAAAVAIVNTPHNEVLGKLLRSGVFGAIAALCVLLLPTYVCEIRSRRKQRNSIMGYSGAMLLLGITLGSLTMGVLGLSFTASFYAIMSALIISQYSLERTWDTN